ncbi:hypothetical protein B0H14DRAFT_3865309, partial [Mycena olivaceomarginata]
TCPCLTRPAFLPRWASPASSPPCLALLVRRPPRSSSSNSAANYTSTLQANPRPQNTISYVLDIRPQLSAHVQSFSSSHFLLPLARTVPCPSQPLRPLITLLSQLIRCRYKEIR